MCIVSAALAGSAGAAIAANVAIAGVAISAVGTGMSVAGQLEAADAANERAKYEQQLALYNGVAEKNKGQVEQTKQGIAQRKEFGAARARAAASGADLTYGSTFRILQETRRYQAFDGIILSRSIQARVLGAKLAGDAAEYNGKVAENNFKWGAAASGVKGVAGITAQLASFTNAGIIGGNNTVGAKKVVEEPTSTPSERREQDYGGFFSGWFSDGN